VEKSNKSTDEEMGDYLDEIAPFDFPVKQYNEQQINPTQVYSGHRIDKIFKYQISEFDNYLKREILTFTEVQLPTWSDPTFQSSVQSLIYPYFENKVFLGFSICHFRDSVDSHEITKIELIMSSTKGILHDTYVNP
jgi:hypothetical protein